MNRMAMGFAALLLVGCTNSGGSGGSVKNLVDQCLEEKGTLEEGMLKQCVSEKIHAQCSQAAAPGSAAYGDCRRDLSRQALTRDQIQRYGF
ncbi:MAG: hypothetical protein U1F33_00050 [Alphaproteobacteria bacterium]